MKNLARNAAWGTFLMAFGLAVIDKLGGGEPQARAHALILGVLVATFLMVVSLSITNKRGEE